MSVSLPRFLNPDKTRAGTLTVVTLAGLQIARAFGAEVTVISRSEEKLQREKSLGATHLINTRLTPFSDARMAFAHPDRGPLGKLLFV